MTQLEDTLVGRVLASHKCCTHPLVVVDLVQNRLCANEENSMEPAWELGTALALDIQKQSQAVVGSHALTATEKSVIKCQLHARDQHEQCSTRRPSQSTQCTSRGEPRNCFGANAWVTLVTNVCTNLD